MMFYLIGCQGPGSPMLPNVGGSVGIEGCEYLFAGLGGSFLGPAEVQAEHADIFLLGQVAATPINGTVGTVVEYFLSIDNKGPKSPILDQNYHGFQPR